MIECARTTGANCPSDFSGAFILLICIAGKRCLDPLAGFGETHKNWLCAVETAVLAMALVISKL